MNFSNNAEDLKNHLEKAIQFCVQKELEIASLCGETKSKAKDVESDVTMEKRIYSE
jgi:hypothetical protein